MNAWKIGAALAPLAIVGAALLTAPTLDDCLVQASSHAGAVSDACARHANRAGAVEVDGLTFAQSGDIGALRWTLTAPSADALAESAELTARELAWLTIADDYQRASASLRRSGASYPDPR